MVVSSFNFNPVWFNKVLIDFQQLGGVDVVWKCLCSGNTEIRIGGCSMVVELSESDPSTQKLVTQQRIISALVDIIEHPNGPTSGKMLIRRAYHAVSGKQ